jgi:putative ABC transport system substrate-binding protein
LKRREFICLLGGAAAWPLAGRAQQPEGMRRVGALAGGVAPDNPDTQASIAAFLQRLAQSWTDGRNLRIDYHWGLGHAANIRKYAAGLVALAPDVILATGRPFPMTIQQSGRDRQARQR